MSVAVTRESIMVALLSRLQAAQSDDAPVFRTSGRRNRNPDTIPPEQTPALMLVENAETYEVQSVSLRPKRRLQVLAIVYADVSVGSDGEPDLNAIPSSGVNVCLDAIDAALVPDSRATHRCTLGGLVESVVISGEVKKAPGDRTGKSLAIVPIEITIP